MSSALTQSQLQEIERLIDQRVKPLEAALRNVEQRMRELQERSKPGLALVAALERRSLPQAQEEDDKQDPLGHDWFDEADLSAEYH